MRDLSDLCASAVNEGYATYSITFARRLNHINNLKSPCPSERDFRSQRSEELVLRVNGQDHSLLYRIYRGTQVERRGSQSQAPHFQIDQVHVSASATLPGLESYVD